MSKQSARGFTITELLICTLVAVILSTVVLTSLASTRGESMTTVSLGNLMFLGVAHETYAADWNGRQVTHTVDDLSTYGNNIAEALTIYDIVHGENHPWLWLGVGSGVIYGFAPPPASSSSLSHASFMPLVFSGPQQGWGHMRVPNAMALNQYVGGRFYDEPYYAPADVPAYSSVERLFLQPYGYVPSSQTGGIKWSSYCYSAAARFDPLVMRAPSAGGWQSPFNIPTGLKTPSMSQAEYPNLKTQIIEHHWNQNPPSMCSPWFGSSGTYNGCEPWYFNHGYDSAPASLFYDGSVRLLPNAEVIAADELIQKQTSGVDGLWSRDTPLGPLGYYGQFAYDNTIVSHHVLTTNGILGRDTLSP